jgi:hypothetical protein
MRTFLALSLATTLVVGTGACSRHPQSTEAAMPAAPTMVTVRNQRFYDMDIFVVRGTGGGGARTRLGTVSGNSTAHFRLSAYLIGMGTALRFVADPIGPSGVTVTEDLQVQPGDNLMLDITP